MKKHFALLALIAVLATAGSAASLYAHHSYGAYDTAQTVSIEGTVLKLDYANPHVILMIKTKDKEYTAEFPAPNVLKQGNFIVSSVKAGDVVVASGSPMRDGRPILSLMKELRRPADGWVWSTASRPNSVSPAGQ